MKIPNKKNITLYHGSEKILEAPRYHGGHYRNDFGNGLYCTEHMELAKEWACGKGRDGYANIYSLDTKGLTILNLLDEKYCTLNWLAILLQFRNVNLNTEVMRNGAKYIKDNFAVNLSGYDVIRGYRADDSYFSFVRAFVSNTITLEQLSRAMMLGDLGEQIMIRSSEAFDRLEFLGFEQAAAAEYFVKKTKRDLEAVERYEKTVSGFDREGIYLADILRGEVGDERIRSKISL